MANALCHGAWQLWPFTLYVSGMPKGVSCHHRPLFLWDTRLCSRHPCKLLSLRCLSLSQGPLHSCPLPWCVMSSNAEAVTPAYLLPPADILAVSSPLEFSFSSSPVMFSQLVSSSCWKSRSHLDSYCKFDGIAALGLQRVLVFAHDTWSCLGLTPQVVCSGQVTACVAPVSQVLVEN